MFKLTYGLFVLTARQGEKDNGCIINTAGQVIESHLDNILADFLGVLRIIGERLGICDHNVDLIVLAGVLKLHTLRKRTHIMAHMKASGGAVSG